MIPIESVAELARAHAELAEPTTGALWIHRARPEAWLVEVIPAMAPDERADEPVFFNPGVEFRFPLALVTGKEAQPGGRAPTQRRTRPSYRRRRDPGRSR